jgi:hypothetical protein
MKNGRLLSLLLFSLCASPLPTTAQDQRCPHFSGAVKNRVEKQAHWLISESLQKHVARRSNVFGLLVAFEQCHVLSSRLLSEEDMMVVEGPFFEADGVPLKSLVGRYQGTWMMAVAPTKAAGKMPDANLLEITNHKWTLLHRDEKGDTRVLATGKY